MTVWKRSSYSVFEEKRVKNRFVVATRHVLMGTNNGRQLCFVNLTDSLKSASFRNIADKSLLCCCLFTLIIDFMHSPNCPGVQPNYPVPSVLEFLLGRLLYGQRLCLHPVERTQFRLRFHVLDYTIRCIVCQFH